MYVDSSALSTRPSGCQLDLGTTAKLTFPVLRATLKRLMEHLGSETLNLSTHLLGVASTQVQRHLDARGKQ